jgi:LuxR family transcriptional regulator, maltose regulon positive regulatory protein
MSTTKVPAAAGTGPDDQGGSTEPVLRSTFVPGQLPNRPVVRARLLDRLTQSVREKPLTLLSAPAGSGKTVCTASWSASRSVPWPIAWLNVDEACDQADTFWPCLVEAFAGAGVDLPNVRTPLSGDPAATSFLMRLAADLLERTHPVVVVLDSAERGLSADATPGLDFLIRHAWPRFRLVMCGRADPLLPLHRYRLTGAMTELRRDELAFTVPETEKLLAPLRVPNAATIAAPLTELTEGWAAGIRLAASSLEQGADPDKLIDSLGRNDSSVAEYLFAEVLDAQPPHVREFLLRTSVADEVWPDLADKLTDRGDAQQTLAGLARANAFVERASSPVGSYRVHPLFRELLRAQLHFESPEDVPDLHVRCARWYASSGQALRAAKHAARAGDWTLTTSLLIDTLAVGSLLAHEKSPYQAVVEALPAELATPAATTLRAALLLGRRQAPSAGDAAALRLATSRAKGIRSRVSAAVVYAAATAGGADSVLALRTADAAEQSLHQLPDDQPGRAELSAVVRASRATALLFGTGSTEEAVRAFESALAASEAAATHPLTRACRAGLALSAALQGRLRQARQLADAVEVPAHDGVAKGRRPAAASVALAWVHCEQCHQAEARRWAALAQENAVGPLNRIASPLLAIVQARLLRLRHDLPGAESALGPVLADPEVPDWLHQRAQLDMDVVYLAQSGPQPALGIVDAMADPKLPLDMRVEALITEASAHAAEGNARRATRTLRHALQLAEPEQMRRPFTDSTPDLRKLLRADPALVRAAHWLSPPAPMPVERRTRTPARPSAPTVRPPALAIEQLSERELQVLRLLSDLLSTEEIGAAMFISVNTVRTHVRSILRKLAVTCRNDAVRRARELGLV